MKYETLLVRQKGPIATVTLNRPQILNAMNKQFFLEFRDLLTWLRGEESIRFVIFTGAGRAFSCGAEFTREAINERYAEKELGNERLWQFFGHDFMHAMENLEQVTIAAINGVAVGAGLCLAMNCDFRIASDDAFIGIPEANLGLFFTWGATPRLCALIGPAKAKELIMTCDNIDAREAMRIGLINQVTDKQDLMNTCHRLAKKIAAKGPMAIRICKKIINAATISRYADLYICEPELVEKVVSSGELDKGVQAFYDKSTPDFFN